MAQAAPREEDRLSLLEGKVEDLTRSLAALEQRFSSLAERATATPPAQPPPRSQPSPEEEEALASPSDLTRILGFLGRTLIAFGGAYLLRAFTAAGFLPEAAGVVLALLYALVWLGLADRAGGRGAALSAGFHGATGVLIGLPLLWETTARFHYLGPAVAGLAVAAFAAAALAVAWRRGLQSLAWIVALAVPATALALLAATHVPAPFGLDLVLLGIAGLALHYGRGWHALGWWTGLTADLGGLTVAFGALAQRRDSWAALAIGLLLGLAYLASLAYRTLARGRSAERNTGGFETVQTSLAVALGYGGAALLALRLGSWVPLLAGGLGLLLAAAAYAAAFRVVPRERRAKLLLWSSLALAFTLAGSALVLPPPGRAAAWSALAALAGWQSLRQRRVTLGLHGAFYSLAAAAASGLLTAAAYAFAAPAGTAWPPFAPVAFLALAAAALVCALPVPHPAPFWEPYEGLTRVLQIAVFLWGAAGIALYLLVPALGGPAAADPGLLATVRTLVLTAVALLLGWAARWPRYREAAWLVYPTLLLAALKLLFEDFPQGRPATLFLALALCGSAFLFAPRLARRLA